MPPPAQQQQGPSFINFYAFTQWMVRFPALTVIVILRRDLGYRLLNPFVLFATCGVLAVLAVLAMPGNEDARPGDLLIFAGVAFLNGLAQRIRRWWELNRSGVQQHTYYIGSSPFNFRWLPDFVRRNGRVARYFDPIFCAAIGFVLLPYSHALAIYLIFAGFCLRAVEHMEFNKQRNRDLDMADSLIISGHQTQIIERQESKSATQPPPAKSGVPTGLGQDIQKKIKIPKSNDPSLN